MIVGSFAVTKEDAPPHAAIQVEVIAVLEFVDPAKEASKETSVTAFHCGKMSEAAKVDVEKESEKEFSRKREDYEDELGGSRNTWLRRCSTCLRQIYLHNPEVNENCKLRVLEYKSAELKKHDQDILEKRMKNSERTGTKPKDKHSDNLQARKERGQTDSRSRTEQRYQGRRRSESLSHQDSGDEQRSRHNGAQRLARRDIYERDHPHDQHHSGLDLSRSLK